MTVSQEQAVQRDLLTYDTSLENTGTRTYTETNTADLAVDLSDVLTGATYETDSFETDALG